MIRFGLVGLGTHGASAVIPAFYDEVLQGKVELVAVCDRKQENLDALTTGERANPRYEALAKFTDINEMLAGVDLDVVYLACGMNVHHDLAVAALKAGKHVICEKPMAATPEECLDMVKVAEDNKRIIAVNFETRFGQKMQTVKRWVDGGYLGRIDAIHFTNMWDCHKNFTASKERRARLIAMAGALDCGIHELDQARFLLGGCWKSVRAVGAWLDDVSVPPSHIGIIGTLDNGPMFTLNASLAFAASIKPRPMLDNIYLVGTEGVAIINTDILAGHTKAELYTRSLCETIEFDNHGHTSDIVLLIQDVVRVVENGMDTPHTFADGVDGYQALLATAQANQDAVEHRSN